MKRRIPGTQPQATAHPLIESNLTDKPVSMGKEGLRQWIWKSYLRVAVLPVIAVSLSFLVIYIIGNHMVYRQNVDAIRQIAYRKLAYAAHQEGHIISERLQTIAALTNVLSKRTGAALDGKAPDSPGPRDRFRLGKDGGLVTLYDNGEPASFYSRRVKVGDKQLKRMENLAVIDLTMVLIKTSFENVISVYFNSSDYYTKIYPYVDVQKQFRDDEDVTKFNFYYRADANHNPARKQVWTEPYLDPAGHGWIVSSIAPVWRENKLEGVVGVDISVGSLAQDLKDADLPWEGFAILVSPAGKIIAMPPRAEETLGLRNLPPHRYTAPVDANTFKPASYDISARPQLNELAARLGNEASGRSIVTFDGKRHLVQFDSVGESGWKILVFSREDRVLSSANALQSTLHARGILLALILSAMIGVFIWIAFRSSQRMNTALAEPVSALSETIRRIGEGALLQTFSGNEIREIDELGHQIVQTGVSLNDARLRIRAQEEIVADALDREIRLNAELKDFTRQMVHEIRNPLAIIDSSMQIMLRNGENIELGAIRNRASRAREAVARISEIVSRLALIQPTGASGNAYEGATDLNKVITDACNRSVLAHPVELKLSGSDPHVRNPAALGLALTNVLSLVTSVANDSTLITVAASSAGTMATISVSFTHDVGLTGTEELSSTTSYNDKRLSAEPYLFVANKIITVLGGNLKTERQAERTTYTIHVPVDVGEPEA